MIDRTEVTLEQEQSLGAGAALRETLRSAVRRALWEMVQEEINGLCGARYQSGATGEYRRAGSAPSSVYLNGHKESMLRPRVRRQTGTGEEEVPLESWKAAQDPLEWSQEVMRAILCGVSCRDAGKLSGGDYAGMSKSAISRLWSRKAGVLIEEMQQSDLSGFDMLVLMVDAVVLSKGLVATVALGLDTLGHKKVLGFQIGSTENREVCQDLLSQLKRRGLSQPGQRALLVVLDGSEALRSAVTAHYPCALIQRCLVHKERNVRGYLSARHWKELSGLFKRLRDCQGSEAAQEVASELRAFLKDKNAKARNSLEEAGDDLLRVFELEVPNTLHRTLLSTNCIENVFKNLRRHIGRVCRWRAGNDQCDRWMASGLTLAQKGFRRIVGHEDLPALREALEKHNEQKNVA